MAKLLRWLGSRKQVIIDDSVDDAKEQKKQKAFTKLQRYYVEQYGNKRVPSWLQTYDLFLTRCENYPVTSKCHWDDIDKDRATAALQLYYQEKDKYNKPGSQIVFGGWRD